MEAGYPAELTSPPVPLVALIGRPDLHLLIGDYLRTQNVPRILSLGLPDPLQAAAKFGERQGAGQGDCCQLYASVRTAACSVCCQFEHRTYRRRQLGRLAARCRREGGGQAPARVAWWHTQGAGASLLFLCYVCSAIGLLWRI